MITISTHVLDTALGKPAAGLVVTLEVARDADRWAEVARGVTTDDGRIGRFDHGLAPLEPQVYRLRFATGAYLAAAGAHAFYPEVHVIFRIDDPLAHYHVPLLLSPFGYSTYRGS
jgi:5-hydroxyisourate hydrolase